MSHRPSAAHRRQGQRLRLQPKQPRSASSASAAQPSSSGSSRAHCTDTKSIYLSLCIRNPFPPPPPRAVPAPEACPHTRLQCHHQSITQRCRGLPRQSLRIPPLPQTRPPTLPHTSSSSSPSPPAPPFSCREDSLRRARLLHHRQATAPSHRRLRIPPLPLVRGRQRQQQRCPPPAVFLSRRRARITAEPTGMLWVTMCLPSPVQSRFTRQALVPPLPLYRVLHPFLLPLLPPQLHPQQQRRQRQHLICAHVADS
jgi:hypothetical protein